jgi:hypothetical protein
MLSMIKERLAYSKTGEDSMILLRSKMYCASDIAEERIRFSCKGIQKDGNNVIYQKFSHVPLMNIKIRY